MQALGFPMAIQFKPDGQGGWIYRRDQLGPGLPATAAERDGYVRWYGWMMLLGGILYFAAMVAAAFVQDRLSGGQGSTVLSSVIGTLGVFALLYLYLRWMAHAPARAWAGRTPVAPALSRRKVFGKYAARTSYMRIVLVSAGLSAVMLAGARDYPEIWWFAIGMPLMIGLAFVIWKWRIEASD